MIPIKKDLKTFYTEATLYTNLDWIKNFIYTLSSLNYMKGFDIVISEEKLGNKKMFVARCLNIDVSSQGRSYEEAEKNIKEAIELNIKTYPDILKEIPKKELMPPMVTKIFL